MHIHFILYISAISGVSRATYECTNKEIHYFIQQRCIKLIKSGSKEMFIISFTFLLYFWLNKYNLGEHNGEHYALMHNVFFFNKTHCD